MITDVIKWHWGPPASKISSSNYQNKDTLSVCRILLLVKTPTGPRVAHCCFRLNSAISFQQPGTQPQVHEAQLTTSAWTVTSTSP